MWPLLFLLQDAPPAEESWVKATHESPEHTLKWEGGDGIAFPLDKFAEKCDVQACDVGKQHGSWFEAVAGDHEQAICCSSLKCSHA